MLRMWLEDPDSRPTFQEISSELKLFSETDEEETAL